MVKRLAILGGQSNAGGSADSALNTNFPGFATPYSGVQMLHFGSKHVDPPVIVRDPANGVMNLQPRTVSMGAPINVGTAGIWPSLGRTYDASRPGEWAVAVIWLDASDMSWWVNDQTTFPTGGPPFWFETFVDYIQAAQLALGASLRLGCFHWLQGTSDALSAPLAAAYLTNISTKFFTPLRAIFGQFPIAIDQISQTFINLFGGGVPDGPTVRTAERSFVAQNARSFLVNSDAAEVSADNAHFTANGYATVGVNHAVAGMQLTGGRGASGYISGYQ